jgi:protocatechuate 3,4-dioxygenase, beta subunit
MSKKRETNPSNDSEPGVFYIPLPRRRFLKGLAAASAGFTLPGYLAEALTLTPSVTQGPYYPLANNIPLDKDNDLIYVNDNLTAATGIITYVTGRVLTASGTPIRGALVELWHADNAGNYTYSTTAARNPAADANFAGFGQYLTGADGAYGFRTIKAGLYRGRTRHYHVGITIPGQLTRYTSQLFWNEVPRDANGNVWDTTNTNDSVLNGITDATQRASVVRDFTLVSGTTSGEQQATYDFVMGLTPVEPNYPDSGSLMLKGTLVAGPAGGNARYKISIPAFAGYSYEVYGNPTLGALGWSALPFSLTQTGTIDRNIYTATAEGTLDVYVESRATKGFYYVSFRVPGANTGTPGSNFGGGPGAP